MDKFKTGLTKKSVAKLNEYKSRIRVLAMCEGNYETSIKDFEKSRKEIVDFLNSYECGLGLGIEIRSFICKKYGEPILNRPDGMSDNDFEVKLEAEPEKYILGYSFTLLDGKNVKVGYFGRKGYDINKDDTAAYADVFLDILARYNPGISVISKDNDRQEFLRLLKIPEGVRRSKLFQLFFALHMNNEEAYTFLTKYSGQQRYNYRSPEEAVALFCFSNEEYNSYSEYLRIMEEFIRRDSETKISAEADNDYTLFAEQAFGEGIRTEEELYKFLLDNRANFGEFSKTAHAEYMKLYNKALEYTFTENAEQLAEVMVQMPAKHEKSDLPASITSKPMISDRINQLKNKKAAVERKDLLFMKFFVFYQKDEYDFEEYMKNGTTSSFETFEAECNLMLKRCGFSELSPLNKFENLLLMSFFADRPYEIFEQIVEFSYDDDGIL